MPQKSKNKHPWYKRKGYLHFDKALGRQEAEAYVTKPQNIIKHKYSPLIHYGKVSRKVSRNKETEKLYKAGMGPKPHLQVKSKTRNIFYTSHVDGYIYSYYAHSLQNAYERFLIDHHLTDNVIAYRAVKKNGIKFCNSHFAHEAFDFVRSTKGCHVLCFDISKFFDRLSPAILKKKWEQILNKDRLPDDHFSVYSSLINFHYVDELDLVRSFRNRFKKNPRQHALIKESGGSLQNRICDYKELRQITEKYKERKEQFIKSGKVADVIGVPQGTAISGLLSNIFMIDFDLGIKKKIEELGGFYRRYSDDIFLVVPPTVSFEEINQFVTNQLAKSCGDDVKVNNDKTEKNTYQQTKSGLFEVVNEKGKSRIQYLGFHFDGQNVYIRNSSISKDRGNTIYALGKFKKRGSNINTLGIYKERSARKVTPSNQIKKKGFVYYASRAANIHAGSKKTILAQIKKNDKFIAKVIVREKLIKRRQGKGREDTSS